MMARAMLMPLDGSERWRRTRMGELGGGYAGILKSLGPGFDAAHRVDLLGVVGILWSGPICRRVCEFGASGV